MLSYRDRTYCGSKTHKPDCKDQFVPDEAYYEWSKALGMPDGGPVAFADYCNNKGEIQ